MLMIECYGEESRSHTAYMACFQLGKFVYIEKRLEENSPERSQCWRDYGQLVFKTM